MGGSEASNQLELAAIFVAFVAVTTLFSFMSLGAGVMGGGTPDSTGVYPVLTAGEPRLAPVGNITEHSPVPENPGTRTDLLAFAVTNTGGEGNVDLSRATVTVMAGDYLEVLKWSDDIPLMPGTWTTALPRDDAGGIPLRAGEECALYIRLDRPIPAGAPLAVRVRLPGDLPCLITGRVGTFVGVATSSLPQD